jgi:hypothetical protein
VEFGAVTMIQFGIRIAECGYAIGSAVRFGGLSIPWQQILHTLWASDCCWKRLHHYNDRDLRPEKLTVILADHFTVIRDENSRPLFQLIDGFVAIQSVALKIKDANISICGKVGATDDLFRS